MTPRDALAHFLESARAVGDRIAPAGEVPGTCVAVVALGGGGYEVTVAMSGVEFVARGADWRDAARGVALAMREHVRAQPSPEDGAVSAVAGLLFTVAPGGVVH